jgi:hypothetical protein
MADVEAGSAEGAGLSQQLSELLQRHVQEKAELAAKVKGMRGSVAKAGKKQKKQVGVRWL